MVPPVGVPPVGVPVVGPVVGPMVPAIVSPEVIVPPLSRGCPPLQSVPVTPLCAAWWLFPFTARLALRARWKVL